MNKIGRAAWLTGKREQAQAKREAHLVASSPQPGQAEIEPLQTEMLVRFQQLCPQNSLILDAAIASGQVWPLLLENGFGLHGLAQTEVLLKRAAEGFPDLPVEILTLQEISFQEIYGGIVCLDALETLPSEDWPLVLVNFWNALRPGGCLYIMVEAPLKEELDQAYQKAQEAGLPVLFGEVVDKASYAYYPQPEQVHAWLAAAGFRVLHEEFEGNRWHLLAQKRRLGMNFLDYDVDERAGSQAP